MTSKTLLIKHSFRGLVDPANIPGREFAVTAAAARRGQIEGKWSKMKAEIGLPSWGREDFVLILQKMM